MGTLQPPSKSQFLEMHAFPPEWDAWDLYPDELLHGQIEIGGSDAAQRPDQHLRYGAFNWWLRGHRDLSEERLIQLCRLAVLDPDTGMAGAAVRGILCHPNATDTVAQVVTGLARADEGWRGWFAEAGKPQPFLDLLSKGRRLWAERYAVHRLAIDLRASRLGEPELRALYATGSALVQRGLVEHPNLPHDLLLQLAQLRAGPFFKLVRSLAERRLTGKALPPTDYAGRYCSDPWFWPRAR